MKHSRIALLAATLASGFGAARAEPVMQPRTFDDVATLNGFPPANGNTSVFNCNQTVSYTSGTFSLTGPFDVNSHATELVIGDTDASKGAHR